MADAPTITELRPFFPHSPATLGAPVWVTWPGTGGELADVAECAAVLHGKIIAQTPSGLIPFSGDRMAGDAAVWTVYEFGLAQQRALIGRELAEQGLLPDNAAEYVATHDFGRLVGEVARRG